MGIRWCIGKRDTGWGNTTTKIFLAVWGSTMLWPSSLWGESNGLFQLWHQHWPQLCQVIFPGLGEVWCLSWWKEVQADEVSTTNTNFDFYFFKRREQWCGVFELNRRLNQSSVWGKSCERAQPDPPTACSQMCPLSPAGAHLSKGSLSL